MRASVAAFSAGLLLLASPGAAQTAAFAPDAQSYQQRVEPFLQRHCVRCHGPGKSKGDLRIDRDLGPDFADPGRRRRWTDVVEMLERKQMPPKGEPQAPSRDVAAVLGWITDQATRAEASLRDNVTVLRRLNRDEYRNTIRDLTGVELDVAALPEDPAGGGFSNNGKILTMSPLLVELYADTAATVLDRALVRNPISRQPKEVSLRFELEEGSGDDHRVLLSDGQKPIVHGGKNRKDGAFTIMNRSWWDREADVRAFNVPMAGEYTIRIRAGGRIPSRAEIMQAVEPRLVEQRKQRMIEQPKSARYNQQIYERDREHFRSNRIYDYGPPRLRVTLGLGSKKTTLAEFDVAAPREQPRVYEFRAHLSTEPVDIHLEWVYSVPKVVGNFWTHEDDTFPRPEAWVDWVELVGPNYDKWPPTSHTRILHRSQLEYSDERGYVREVLKRFMTRAFRRPVTDAEVAEKVDLYQRFRKQELSLVAAIKTPLIAVLSSPHFLYLVEPLPASGADGPRALTDHELASRLSYFLWSSMPDEALLRAAAQGKLHEPRVIAQQVERMLSDPRSRSLADDFASEWLGLREAGLNPPVPELFPSYDRHLEVSMVGEAKGFFDEILHKNRSVLNFLRSDFLVLNERMARFYGISGVRGDAFRVVPAPAAAHRGGLLTQASMLITTSNGTRTSPVKRGVWILKNLLDSPTGSPVANAGEIKTSVPGVKDATVRQRFEAHRRNPECARCHDKIDPLGFALENYTAGGEWREREGFGWRGLVQDEDPKIDASSTLADGTRISGVKGLTDELIRRSDRFRLCLVRKLFTYALGRELALSDETFVAAAVTHTKKNGDTLASLISFIATSALFRNR